MTIPISADMIHPAGRELVSQETCTASCDCRLSGGSCHQRDLQLTQQLRDEIRDRVADLLAVVEENRLLLGGPLHDDPVSFAELAVRAYAEELGYPAEHTRAPTMPPTRRQAADRAIAKAFRRIGERDGFRCRVCGIHRTLTVDHVIAVVNGGSDDDDNLQILCRSHNSSKGAR